MQGKERTSRESKSVFLERYQIKCPFYGILQGPVECESLEGTAMLCIYNACPCGVGCAVKV